MTWEPVAGEGALASGLAVAAAEGRVREHLDEGGGEGGGVAGWDDAAGLAILTISGRAPILLATTGMPCMRASMALIPWGSRQGGEGEDGAAEQEAADFGKGDAAADLDIGDVDSGRAAGDDEAGVGEFSAGPGGRLRMRMRAALSLPVDADEEDGAVRVIGVVGRRGGRREIGGGADDGDARWIAMVILGRASRG